MPLDAHLLQRIAAAVRLRKHFENVEHIDHAHRRQRFLVDHRRRQNVQVADSLPAPRTHHPARKHTDRTQHRSQEKCVTRRTDCERAARTVNASSTVSSVDRVSVSCLWPLFSSASEVRFSKCAMNADIPRVCVAASYTVNGMAMRLTTRVVVVLVWVVVVVVVGERVQAECGTTHTGFRSASSE